MIIANVGHLEFKLDSLSDAEALLRILSAAVPVDTDYRLNGIVFETKKRTSIEIKIISGDVMSEEEANQLIADYEKGRIRGVIS